MSDSRAPQGSLGLLPVRPDSSEVSACVESLCLPGRALTLTEMLRALDVLRRRIARSTRGREGAFAGFDCLDVSHWDEDAEGASVVFTAELVADEGRTQVVQYTASRCHHHAGECRTDTARTPYLRGSGRTVGLSAARAHREDVMRFTIASPHR